MGMSIKYPGSDQYTAREQAAPGSQPIDMAVQPIVKVDDTAYIKFQVTDLDKQQRFMEDFGLHLAESDEAAIYMRGAGTQAYCYVATQGKSSRFLGAGFTVNSLEELEVLSSATGQPIEQVEGPGLGRRVCLKDPDGFIVDVIYGREQVAPLATRRELLPVNTPANKQRVNKGQRPPLEPTAVERFGHYVLSVTDFEKSWKWYRRHLGVLPSDVLCTDEGVPVLVFSRLDRGSKPADHHAIVLMQGLTAKCMHSAFEALDQDAIGQGNQFLRLKGWEHFWGIGRHILGSQIFDYWLDPASNELEHYADGDVFDSEHPAQYHLIDRGGLWAWGNDVPPAMRPKIRFRELFALVGGLASGRLDASVVRGIKRAMARRPRPWLK